MNRFNIFGVGFNSKGEYKTRINGRFTKCYNAWQKMLERCYSEKSHEKYPTYKDCSVAKEWLDYQVFAEWWEENYYEIGNEKMCLDKDILVKGNKIYSPQTCMIVPNNINMLFVKHDKKRGECPIGVYKDNNPKLKSKKYKAQISYKGKQITLGHFDNKHKAFLMYKINKELLIQGIANEYKELIPTKLYDALMNYEVSEED